MQSVIHRCSALAWAAVFVSFASFGDSIVISGKRYEDVLVNKGATTYYVRIPNEGRMLTASKDKVDASSVVINSDPFYRSELKERYEQVREAGGAPPPDGRVFEGAGVVGGASGSESSGSPGGGSSLAGQTQGLIKSQLSGFGVQFQPTKYKGQPASKGTLPTGGSITLIGPGDQLKGIAIEMQGPEQMIGLIVNQTKGFFGPGADLVQVAFNKAKESGSATESKGGVTVTITYKANGPNVNFAMEFMGI